MTKAIMNTSSTATRHPEDVAHLLRAFVKWLQQRPEVEVRARLGRPAPAASLKRAGVPSDLAQFYGTMCGIEVRWWLRGCDPDDPEAGGWLRVPSLHRNRQGWSRSDFFTDDPEKPRELRVPDEVPLLRRDYHRPLWWEGYKTDTLVEMWEIGGDTASDVGLGGFDDYIERGIDRLFISDWTSLIADVRSPEVEERLARVYEKLGIKPGWFERLRAGRQHLTILPGRRGRAAPRRRR